MFFTYIYSFCMCAYMHMPWQACRSQRTTFGMVLSFYPEGPRDQIEVSRLGSKHSQMRVFLVKLIFRVVDFQSCGTISLSCSFPDNIEGHFSFFTSQKGKRAQITPGNFVSSAKIRLSAVFTPWCGQYCVPLKLICWLLAPGVVLQITLAGHLDLNNEILRTGPSCYI